MKIGKFYTLSATTALTLALAACGRTALSPEARPQEREPPELAAPSEAPGAVSTQGLGSPAAGGFIPTPASPGALDPSFDGDGRVLTSFQPGHDGATAVAVQADGKIVAAGYASQYGDFAVARYNSNGSLDTTFSTDGMTTTGFGSDHDVANAVAVLSGGKILAAGSTLASGAGDFALAVYDPNGTPDTTFSGDGKLTLDFGGGYDAATAVGVQFDGKIVVAGYAQSGSQYNFAVARYNTNGTLDTTFTGDGKQTIDFGASATAHAMVIAPVPSNKIVLAGTRDAGGNKDFAVARLTSDGYHDTTFSGDGELTTNFAGGDDLAHALALQPDGRIVAAGSAVEAGEKQFALARYNADGSLDASFSDDGKRTVSFGPGEAVARGVALQANGKIVAAGYFEGGAPATPDYALVRLNTNGSSDASFSGDGKLIGDFFSHSRANAMALQADGKIVTAGTARVGGEDRFALLRFWP